MYKLYCYFWLNSSFCGAVNFVQVIQSWECFALHLLGFQSFSLLFFFFSINIIGFTTAFLSYGGSQTRFHCATEHICKDPGNLKECYYLLICHRNNSVWISASQVKLSELDCWMLQTAGHHCRICQSGWICSPTPHNTFSHA